MSHNKSARKRAERKARIEKKYRPKPAAKNTDYPESPMGNLDYDGMGRLARKYDVSQSRILCGYLRQPIDYSGSDETITGNCALTDKDCTYIIPRVGIPYSCVVYQDYFDTPYVAPDETQGGIEQKVGD